MISFQSLPALNATLNALTAICLVSGFMMIRRNRIAAHRAFMLTAVGLAVLFLISYITYHSQVGITHYTKQGWIRTVYFSILISHTILAATIVPLATLTVIRALRGNFERHRKIARWTLPLWLYVSVTGVIIYFMLYGNSGDSLLNSQTELSKLSPELPK